MSAISDTNGSKLPFFLFLIGLILFGVNLYGLTTSLRNDDIYFETKSNFPQDITLTEGQVHEAINATIVDRKIYVTSVTAAINKGIAHYWRDEGLTKYNIKIPFTENYLLFVASFIAPSYFRKYEFFNYEKAIERGVGLCSQHAIIVAEVLKEKGIETKVVSLSGHVVATAEVDPVTNEWWILDADFGVIIPRSIGEIERNPELVRPYYSDSPIQSMPEIYQRDGNYLSEGNGAKNYVSWIYYIETLSYVFIWIIPVVLVVPYFAQNIARALRKVRPIRSGS